MSISAVNSQRGKEGIAFMEENNNTLSVKRVFIYTAGILFVSLGIVLCKKCGMGISPVSSIPLVLSELTPLTFGSLTACFHFMNTAFQMLLSKKMLDLKLWMQVPLAFVFGVVIDWLNGLVFIDEQLSARILSLLFSIFFTALGMVCMLDMNLIQNPPDGTVKQISVLSGWELGAVKTAYDGFCVLVSVVLGLLFLHAVRGFGIATIVSAVFVGKSISWLRAGAAKCKVWRG